MRRYFAAAACFSAGIVTLALACPAVSPAQQAPAPTAETTAAPPATATAAAPTSAAQPATTTATAAKPSLDAEEKRLISMGYKPEMRRGEKVFCRSEPVLGSRFAAKKCAPPEELKAITRDSQSAMEHIQRTQINPVGH